MRFALPVHDNLEDRYTIVAWAKDYKQAGFTPVTVSAGTPQMVQLMLIPESNQFNFATAKWPDFS